MQLAGNTNLLGGIDIFTYNPIAKEYLANVKLELRLGYLTNTAEPIAEFYTDSAGYYKIANLTSSTYTISAHLDQFYSDFFITTLEGDYKTAFLYLTP